MKFAILHVLLWNFTISNQLHLVTILCFPTFLPIQKSESINNMNWYKNRTNLLQNLITTQITTIFCSQNQPLALPLLPCNLMSGSNNFKNVNKSLAWFHTLRALAATATHVFLFSRNWRLICFHVRKIFRYFVSLPKVGKGGKCLTDRRLSPPRCNGRVREKEGRVGTGSDYDGTRSLARARERCQGAPTNPKLSSDVTEECLYNEKADCPLRWLDSALKF